MKPVSGKIDRKSLPDLAHLLHGGGPEHTGERPHTLLQKAKKAEISSAECDQVLEICRTVFETPLGPDDEFALSGGHSIAIARLAQTLQAAGWSIGVRALLTDCDTARKIANRPRAVQAAASARSATSKQDTPVRDAAAAEILSVPYFTTLQILFALFQYSPALVALIFVLDEAEYGVAFVSAGLREYLVAGLVLYIVVLTVPFAVLVWAMLIKSFMGGDVYKNNVTPGVYPKWSRMHLRIWCISRIQSMVLVPLAALYRSAPLRAFAIGQLGATVGTNLQCAHDSVLDGPLDLVTIDDDVAIQTGAYIHTTRWLGQFLEVGPIHLESGCKIGMRAAVANDVTVGSGTWVTPFTPILSNIGSHEVWEGSPARLTGRCTELKRTAKACEYAQPIWLLESVNVLMQTGLSFALTAVPVAVILWLVGTHVLPGTFVSDLRSGPFLEVVWHLTLYTFLTTWVSIVLTSVLGCIFIRLTAASPGLYPSRALKAALLMYRVHRMNAIQTQWTWTVTGQYLRALAGMRFERVGASECDVMHNLVPELATAGAQVFWSNGCFTNMLDYGAEHITLRQLDMPHKFFTGNNCVAECGHFPSNFLLGVSTPASDINFRRQMRARPGSPIIVAGNPPVRFARAHVDEQHLEKDASFLLFLSRVLLNDVFSIGMIPVTAELLFLILYIALERSVGYPVAGAFAALALAEIGVLLLCITVKNVMVGKKWGAGHSTPFWSWRHFAYFFAQDCFFVWCREPLRFLAGTTAANSILRRMGCRIGERTIVTDPMQCSGWNAVSVGSDCYVAGFLQFHTFENLTLTVKRTTLEDGCAVNTGATIMGGAVIERDSTLLPLSMVLKEMDLSTATYHGSPAEAVSDPEGTALRQVETTVENPAAVGVSRVVDNTDWLKLAAIILVLVDHVGYFFIDDDHWWSVFGRMAAPSFFFLIGYAQTRAVPLQWIFLGAILTLLDSSNNGWTWVAPNILVSFSLIRFARPYAQRLTQRYGLVAYAIVAAVLVALLPGAANVLDYGTEGWLWALLGMAQRMRVDARSVNDPALSRTTTYKYDLIRILVCIVAAAAYILQEQKEFQFSSVQFNTFVLCLGILSLVFLVFARGASRIQPPSFVAAALRSIGRQTLAIYALELAAFEIVIKVWPEIGP
jgi:non-ribosomal peptide synthetase-like protein